MTIIAKYEGGPLDGKIRAYSEAHKRLTSNGGTQELKAFGSIREPGYYKPKDQKRKGFGTFENPLIYTWVEVPKAKVPAVPQQTV